MRYAIRFLGTDYCSVWKYQTKDNGPFEGTTQYVLVVTAKSKHSALIGLRSQS